MQDHASCKARFQTRVLRSPGGRGERITADLTKVF
jgi:hypothetical protein